MCKSLLYCELQNMYRCSMKTSVLLACLSFAVLPDVALSKLEVDKHNQYRVGQIQGDNLSTANNRTFCRIQSYASFNLFYDDLTNLSMSVSDQEGTRIPSYFLTTFVSGTPEERHPESGATTIVGSQNKLSQFFSVCTYNKTLNAVEGGYANSRINWLAWGGNFARLQQITNFYAEFEVGRDGRNQSCLSAPFDAVDTWDPFLVSAGLCGNYLYPGNVAVWVNRIFKKHPNKKHIEICVAIDIPHPGARICAYGIGIQSKPSNWVGNDAELIEAKTVKIDFPKSRCVERQFERRHEIAPVVFVSPSYHTESNQLHAAPIAWVEYSNELGFKACVNPFGLDASDDEDSFFSNLSLDYAVIPLDDEVLNVNPAPMRNAITLEIQKMKVVDAIGILSQNGLLGRRLCSVFKDAVKLEDMHCHLDSILESKAKIRMNFVVQHEKMKLDGLVLSDVKERIEKTLAILYWLVTIRAAPLAEKDSELQTIAMKIENDPEKMELYERAINIYASLLSEKELYKYNIGILELIAATHESLFEVIAHQECVVSGFTSGKCSVPTCIPGVYNGTKTIERTVLSMDTKPSLCPVDLKSVVSCNQSPCEVDRVTG